MTGGPAVRLEGVRKSYDGHVDAVGGLDLAVPAGQVFGLLGPNGAGKTTVLRAILGLVRPSAGRVTVLGRAPGSAALTGRVGALVESPRSTRTCPGEPTSRCWPGISAWTRPRWPPPCGRWT